MAEITDEPNVGRCDYCGLIDCRCDEDVLRYQLAEVRDEPDKLAWELEDVRSTLGAYKEQIDDMEDERDKLEERVECLENSVEHQGMELSDAKAENKRLKEAVHAHEDDCVCLPQNKSVTDTVTEQRAERDKLRKRVDELEMLTDQLDLMHSEAQTHDSEECARLREALEGCQCGQRAALRQALKEEP